MVESPATELSENLPILFGRKRGQLALLKAIDQLHQAKRVGSIIEIADIVAVLGKAENNFSRNLKHPLLAFIREIEYENTNENPTTPTCYTLDYERLSSDVFVQELIDDKETEKLDAPDSSTVQKQENKIAEEQYGFKKTEGASVANIAAFTSSAMTSFFSIVPAKTKQDAHRNNKTGRLQHTVRVPYVEGSYVTLTSANKRFVEIQDVPVLMAASIMTHAYHYYRRHHYEHNQISPKNDSPVSLQSMRLLLGKHSDSRINKTLREAFDATRDTAFDFVDGFNKDKRDRRRRIFECDPIRARDVTVASEEDASQTFYTANLFVLKWDDEIFSSLLNDPNFFSMPRNLLQIDALFVVLYLKLRGIKDLKTGKNKQPKPVYANPENFCQRYLQQSLKEFIHEVEKAERKLRAADVKRQERNAEAKRLAAETNTYPEEEPEFGFKIQLDYEIGDGRTKQKAILIDLFGYNLTIVAASEHLAIHCSAQSINQHLDLPDENNGQPTIPNPLADYMSGDSKPLPAHIQEIVEQDVEVNSIQESQFVTEVEKHYLVIWEEHEPNVTFVLSHYTQDEKLAQTATILQTIDKPRGQILEELTSLRGGCLPLSLGERELTIEAFTTFFSSFVLLMRLTRAVDTDRIIRYLAQDADALEQVLDFVDNGIEIEYSLALKLSKL